MTKSEKEFESKMYDRAQYAIMKAFRYTRSVVDFQVLRKKEFDAGWGNTHVPEGGEGWKDVRKSHRYVGVLTLKYGGERRSYAVSHWDPVFACAYVLKRTLRRYEGERMYKSLMRFHDKFFAAVLEPM